MIYLCNLRYLLRSMGFAPESWIPVYEDNNACIEWSNNIIGGRERAKHIDIRKHFAHEPFQNGHLRLVRVSTSKQLADIFTKELHALGSLRHSLREGKGRRSSRGVERFRKSSHVGPYEG